MFDSMEKQTEPRASEGFHTRMLRDSPSAQAPVITNLNAEVAPTKSRFDTRLLSSQDEIDQARHLLYQVYIEEMGWKLSPDNPSGLKVEASAYGPMLVDRFDASSLWFGCSVEGRLVGIHRIHHSEEQLEIELYTQIPNMFKNEMTVELSRLAIAQGYRAKSPVFVLLMATEFEYLRERGVRYALGTAPFPSPGELYVNAGMKRCEDHSFKYYESDPEMVSIIYYDFSEPAKLDRLIRLAKSIKNSTRRFS